MDQLKKHLFWIIYAVVVLGVVGTWYFVLMPDLKEAKAKGLADKAELQRYSNEAGKPDGIKTGAHATAANDLIKKLDAEKKALIDTIKSWPDLSEAKVEARYKEMDKDLVGEPPAASKNIDFDNWMDKQRTRLKKKLTDAGVAFKPEDVDRWLFFGITVDPTGVNANIKRHRDYQLRVLAIFEEVVEAVGPRTGTQPISTFETDPLKPEGTGTTPVGVLHLDNFTYHTPDETGPLDAKGYEAALAKSSYKAPAVNERLNPSFKGAEMPVTVSSAEVEFTSHISAVPIIQRKLEASEKYFAVLAKVDCERVSPVYSGPPTDTTVQQTYKVAAYNPMINTHYGEGPVKAYVMLEFYEFSKAKAEKMDAPPPAPAPVRPGTAAHPAAAPAPH